VQRKRRVERDLRQGKPHGGGLTKNTPHRIVGAEYRFGVGDAGGEMEEQ
jgi:hypothetical protein